MRSPISTDSGRGQRSKRSSTVVPEDARPRPTGSLDLWDETPQGRKELEEFIANLRCATGEQQKFIEAMEGVVRKQSWAYFRKFGRQSGCTVEDIIQDAWTKVIESIGPWVRQQGEGSLGSFLCTCLMNHFKDRIRSLIRRSQRGDIGVAEQDDVGVVFEGVDSRQPTPEDLAQTAEILRKLPDRVQHFISLRLANPYATTKDVADAMGVRPGTLYSDINRVRPLLEDLGVVLPKLEDATEAGAIARRFESEGEQQ